MRGFVQRGIRREGCRKDSRSFGVGALSHPAGIRLLCALTEAAADALQIGQIYARRLDRTDAALEPELSRLGADIGAFVRRVFAEVSPSLAGKDTPDRRQIDQALLACASLWLDDPLKSLDLSRRELAVAHAVVASLTERSQDPALRLRAAKSLHRLIDESLWGEYRFAKHAANRVVAGLLDGRWSYFDFDYEQLEQIYTGLQLAEHPGGDCHGDGFRTYFHACTLGSVPNRFASEPDVPIRPDFIGRDAGADVIWLKESLAIAELFKQAIDTAEVRRDVAVICYKLAYSSLVTRDVEASMFWLNRAMASLRPRIAMATGLLEDVEASMFAKSLVMLEQIKKGLPSPH